jgi:RES domain-containing protein
MAWRIVPAQWAGNAFDGEGARLYGGRWNSPGRAAVYLADSRALAALEALVYHASAPRIRYVRYAVRFERNLVEQVDQESVGEFLDSLLVAPETQAVGDDWLKQASKPVLEVPSAIISEERNYLLNPAHPEFDQIAIGHGEDFAFDPRLIQSQA